MTLDHDHPIRFLKISNGKKSHETHEQSYAVRDIEIRSYLQDLKSKLNRPLSIIDIGGGCEIRLPDTTHVVDLLPLSYFGNNFDGGFFQGDIDLSDVWNKLFDYVDKNGKFDFAVCSHTLEDINAPHQVILNLCKIANAGMIAVPSKYIETIGWETVEVRRGPHIGYSHHRWIYTIKNGIFYGYPKMGLLENSHFVSNSDFPSRAKYRQVFGAEGYETQTEMAFLWEKTIPVKFVAPFMYYNHDFTENNRDAYYNLIERDDICNLISEM